MQHLLLSVVGLGFWKCPRRKWYAVDLESIPVTTPQGSRKRFVDYDSDDDCEPISKKGRYEEKLDALITEVGCIKDSLSEMMTLSADCRMPLGLKRILKETFKCRICPSIPIRPPVIASKCCKTLLGCESCINSWYSGPDALTKTCPFCRAERGYNETMMLRGLDEFLIQIRKVVQEEEEQEENVILD